MARDLTTLSFDQWWTAWRLDAHVIRYPDDVQAAMKDLARKTWAAAYAAGMRTLASEREAG